MQPRIPTGTIVAHPHEMWLYTCKGSNKNEWYLEKPVRVVLPHNFKLDGSLPAAQLPLLQWLSSKDKPLRPLHAPDFTAYTAPIPLELANQWDLLRTLSKFLPPPITQADIDRWYPERLSQIQQPALKMKTQSVTTQIPHIAINIDCLEQTLGQTTFSRWSATTSDSD